jgi:D-alanyl-D-alanine carboxypeptidase/D-alanyl-D-alanine-endopeptidase (penicillin-binding protein 4)
MATALVAALLAASTGCADRADRPAPAAAGAPERATDERVRQAPSTSVPDPPACPSSTAEPAVDGLVPPDVVAAVEARVADPRLAAHDVSFSVTVEGWGEVVSVEPDRGLLPASNQKLLTAMGALEVLPADGRFETRVVTAGPRAGGVVDGDSVVDGDLVLVGGGDPTLTGAGLDDLAAQVRAAGITEVRGAVLVDETRYDTRRAAEGWLDWQQPAYVGALSALVIDENRYRDDPEFLADPARVGSQRFADALARRGVRVAGGVGVGPAPDAATVVARRTSPTFGELIATMLTRSDNTIAESLVREISVHTGGDGSTDDGLASIHVALARWCVPIAGIDHDGSGLSRANARSASEWRRLLAAAAQQPWWPALAAGLPVAGESGTLARRLTGPPTRGNVRAKTGSIIPGRALSGYATTVGGRAVVFSLVVNGNAPGPAEGALDDLITTVVAQPG